MASGAVELLKGTKELLIRDGWIQGAYHNKKRQHCLLGALSRVQEDMVAKFEDYQAAETCLRDQVQLYRFGSVYNIVQFNDDPARKFEDIVDVIEKSMVCAAKW